MSKLKLIANKPLFSHNSLQCIRIGLLPAAQKKLAVMESVDVEYDKTAGTLFLKPLQLTEAYQTQFTGAMTRYSKALNSFTYYDSSMVLTPSIADEWEDVDHENTKNTFLASNKNSGGYVFTKNAIGNPRGFFYRFSLPPTSNTKELAIHLFFGGYYKLDVYSNGLTVLYSKEHNSNYAKVGQGYITGGVRDKQDDIMIADHSARLVTLYILPIRSRCLYIHCPSLGGSWTWVHQKATVTGDKVVLSHGASSLNAITQEAPMGFKMGYYAAHVQMMPLVFPLNGFITINYECLESIPNNSTYVFNERGYYGDGTNIEFGTPQVHTVAGTTGCSISVTYAFHSDSLQKYTPLLSSHTITYTGTEIAVMDDGSTDISKWDKDSMSLDLTSDSSSRVLSWKTSDENTVNYLKGKCNIPITLETNEGFEIFYGLLDTVSYNPGDMSMDLTARDLWKIFDNARFGGDWVADGLRHTDAIAYLLKYAGIPDERIYIGSDTSAIMYNENLVGKSGYRHFSPKGTEEPDYGDGFRLETSDSNEPAVAFKTGSTVSAALRYIHETYTIGEWTMGFYYNDKGTIVFAYIPNESFDTISPITFVTKSSDTGDSGVVSREGFNYKYIEPEATDVRVVGSISGNYETEATSDAIVVEMSYPDNENRALPVASRTMDWVGEKRYFGIQRNDFNTEEKCNYFCYKLLTKLSKQRVLIEFNSTWDFKVYPGATIYIAEVGYIKIKSMQINFSVDNLYTHDFPTKYMGELRR